MIGNMQKSKVIYKICLLKIYSVMLRAVEIQTVTIYRQIKLTYSCRLVFSFVVAVTIAIAEFG